ncbi:MAG: hypothetical protein CL833_07345 [Crocinitomicaceae bacterium]|nr:hypothetical protein [Crocinitomicaceae bacterium]|tara:strand:- start:1751 stop:1993 length:243 start_codon:yes stop_codon:yes gene_type:complete
MIFKIKDLGSEEDLNITSGEIISTELNELKLKAFNKEKGFKEYRIINSTLQIGQHEIFLYGWLKDNYKQIRIKYALNILE